MLLLFIRFLLIGKAFIEPLHDGGVFILQRIPVRIYGRGYFLYHSISAIAASYLAISSGEKLML
jgi:hypothetical protein